jgi:hypothetical protein
MGDGRMMPLPSIRAEGAAAFNVGARLLESAIDGGADDHPLPASHGEATEVEVCH